jgi:hypothetical protein
VVTWVPQLQLYHRVRLTLCCRFPLVHCADFLIAEFDICMPSLPGTVPVWFEVLAGAGFNQGWLSGIYLSLNCSFSPDIPRAGVFIRIGEDESCVQFLCKYHVPVWYPWGPKQEAWAHNYPWLAMYAPLPEQFQAVTTSLA